MLIVSVATPGLATRQIIRSAAARGGNFRRNTNRASVLGNQRTATQCAAGPAGAGEDRLPAASPGPVTSASSPRLSRLWLPWPRLFWPDRALRGSNPKALWGCTVIPRECMEAFVRPFVASHIEQHFHQFPLQLLRWLPGGSRARRDP